MTPARVRLAPLLAQLFPDAPRMVDVKADTVAALIDALDGRWPGMGACLRDERPAIRRHINVFGGRRVGLDEPLAPGADVHILTAISGG
jgi:molybdopterin converting factor small subunit